MNHLEIVKKQIDIVNYKKRSAKETDYATLIKNDCLITQNGIPKILYCKLTDVDTSLVRKACINIRYDKSKRTEGLITHSRTFGYNPRNTIRRNYCSTTSMVYDHPKEHSEMVAFGEKISEYYKKYFPDVYKSHQEAANEKIYKDWKIGQTPFTSGIVNKNNPLKYHFDAGNIKSMLSNMIVFKDKSEGGYLSCPEYDIAFEVEDNSIVIFDGQSILHGVTPIKLYPQGYRYSVVYYTLQSMWSCLPVNDELIWAGNKGTKGKIGELKEKLVN